jgi:hypothetical protein
MSDESQQQEPKEQVADAHEAKQDTVEQKQNETPAEAAKEQPSDII